MGEQKVSLVSDQKQMQKFVKSLLNDVTALEFMLDNDWFESDVIRIGAEQEMVMVDKTTFKPSLVACLLYTSDAADERSSVDLGGRRIIKKKKRHNIISIPKQKRKQIYRTTNVQSPTHR